MTRKLPANAWVDASLDAERRGIPSVPGAKWLIKPGEIQLGAFNTYRGWMRGVASPTMPHDFSRWLWPRSQLRAPAAIYQRRGECSRSKRSRSLSRNGPGSTNSQQACVRIAATCETRARNSANRTEIRADTVIKASFDKRTSKRTTRQRPAAERYILVSC